MSELHVYSLSDCEWVVARNADDALKVYAEHVGEDSEDYAGELEFEQLAEDHVLEIWCDDTTGLPGDIKEPGHSVVRLTAAEWAARCGRGYLSTTEQ